MNTNKVYVAQIYRLIEERFTATGSSILDSSRKMHSVFSRYTVVYDKGNGEFYDLLTKSELISIPDYFTPLGTEHVKLASLVPFNNIVENKKIHRTVYKIKKMIKENEIIEQCNTLVQEQSGPRLVKKKLPPKQ